jgi:hypothetical protein
MQFNIIYVPEKMSFQLNEKERHLGRGVYVLTDDDVLYLYADTDISLDEVNALAAKKLGTTANG